MPLRSILILSSHQILGFPRDSFRRIFLMIVTFRFSYQTSYGHLSHECYMLCPFHAPWLGDSNNNKAKSFTNYEAFRYAVFSSLLLFQPSWVQIFTSAPRSQLSPSLCSYFSTRNRASHHTKLWAKLRGFLYFNHCVLWQRIFDWVVTNVTKREREFATPSSVTPALLSAFNNIVSGLGYVADTDGMNNE
jgi:hypothetical protein